MVTTEELKLIINCYLRFMIEPVYKSKRVVNNEFMNCKFESNYSPNFIHVDPWSDKITFYFVERYVGSRSEASRQKIASVRVRDLEEWYELHYKPVLEQLEENLKQMR